jgi:iron complex transport system ATP-binding protein
MLKLKNISVSFGRTKIVDAVNFTLEKGKLLALVGPNGAGKSTLLKAISGDLTCSGEILLHNQNIAKFKKTELAQIKAVMAQKSSINFDFLVKEITMMGRYPHFKHAPTIADEEVVKSCHQQLELTDFEDRMHTALSGGEQQRNHFCRSLAQLHSKCALPKLLLLDEPLNNLDVKHQYKLMNHVKAFIAEGNSAIIVIHDVNIAAEFADEILMLKNGKTVDFGSVESVFTESNLSYCYEIPALVQKHPIKNHPLIFFNAEYEKKEKIEFNKTIVNPLYSWGYVMKSQNVNRFGKHRHF